MTNSHFPSIIRMLRHLITIDDEFQRIPKHVIDIIFTELIELIIPFLKQFDGNMLVGVFLKNFSMEQFCDLVIDLKSRVLFSFFCLKHFNVSSMVQGQRIFTYDNCFCNTFHITTSTSTCCLDSLRRILRFETYEWKCRESPLVVNSNASFFRCQSYKIF